MKQNKTKRFMLCIENKDCEDLERRKIYQVLPDDEASKEGYLRVIDESGEDYLYPESYFILLQLPREAEEALQAASLIHTFRSKTGCIKWRKTVILEGPYYFRSFCSSASLPLNPPRLNLTVKITK